MKNDKIRKFKLIGQSVAAIIMFGGAGLVAPVMAADTMNGSALYNIHCSNCHGQGGAGMMPGMPNFSRGEGLFQTDTELVPKIEQGIGMMPAYRGLLSTQDILDVIAYLRTLH